LKLLLAHSFEILQHLFVDINSSKLFKIRIQDPKKNKVGETQAS